STTLVPLSLHDALPIYLMEVPGLTAARIQLIYERLGVQNLEDLERVAKNGELADLPKFGRKTAEKILRGIEIVRRDAHLQRFPRSEEHTSELQSPDHLV